MTKPILAAVDLTNMLHTDWRAVNGNGQNDIKDATQFSLRRCRAMRDQWKGKVVCCVDSPQSYRREKYPDYKAHRGPKPESLTRQLFTATHLLSKEFPVIDSEGFEADDLLASLAFHGSKAGYRVILVTQDKDVNQCLLPGEVNKCQRLRIRQNVMEPEWLTDAALRQEYGFGPERWIDYQCLVGDPTDGIVGCEGVGPETAKWLLSRKPLEDWLETPNQVPKVSLRDALLAFKGRYESVYDLVRLHIDVPGVEDVLL